MLLRVGALLIVGLLIYGGYWVGSKAFFLETPEYTVELEDGNYEVRQYPELSVVSTSMTANGDDSAFMRLFGFIQGGNESGEKIAMTTPVLMDGSGSGETMSFVVPEEVKLRGVPGPANPKVRVETRKANRVAVYRYSGVATDEGNLDSARKLKSWVMRQGLEIEGEAVFAFYDAPFVPGIFRRNEVMFRIAG